MSSDTKGSDEPPGQDALTAYLRGLRRYELLTRSGEHRLARQQRDHPSSPKAIAARRWLLEANLRFVVKLAYEYRRYGVSVDELIQEGNLGLIEAATRFDPERGVRFVNYAVWWIRKFMLEAIRRASKNRNVPVQSAAPPGGDTSSSSHELDAIRRGIVSFDGALRSDGGSGLTGSATASPAPDPESWAVDRQMEEALRSVLDRFPEIERKVLEGHYGLDGRPARTLQQIGDEIGYTRERVRQIEIRARERARRLLRRGL